MALDRSARLRSLLRRFGLSVVQLEGRESREVAALLRARYFELAKRCHPDVAPGQTAAAEFVELQRRFREASRLLQEGVRPSGAESQFHFDPDRWRDGEPKEQPPSVEFYFDPYKWQRDDAPRRPKPERKDPEFDAMTRVKGVALVVSFLSGVFYLFDRSARKRNVLRY